MPVNQKHPKYPAYLDAWDLAARRSGVEPKRLAYDDYRAKVAGDYAEIEQFDHAINSLNEICPNKINSDFRFTWLNEEKTRLSVNFVGEVPEVYDHKDDLVQDAGLIDWPSYTEISQIVGKQVEFSDKGDDLLEGIFHAKE
jgi:hypothetical protein